jgi:hypothetical protein
VIIRFLYLAKSCENPCFSWISIIFPLWIGSYFKLIYWTPLDQNLSLPILPFLCINQHSLFLPLEAHLHYLIFYRFFEPPFPTQHPPSCLCMPSSQTLAEITFHSSTSFIAFHHQQPFLFNYHHHAIHQASHSTENTVIYAIFTSSPVSCIPRVMSHSTATMAAPVKEWLLSYTLWLNSGNSGTLLTVLVAMLSHLYQVQIWFFVDLWWY